ncbi:hypothetical protein C8F01DRAFT_1248123 [Mycena amicta]|nr:hypothetical protein C8F01DRAFT_1248123 [Mycena amicta]
MADEDAGFLDRQVVDEQLVATEDGPVKRKIFALDDPLKQWTWPSIRCTNLRHLPKYMAPDFSLRTAPLHRVKEWSGEFWVDCALFSNDANSSGTALGMVYQLGHHGFDCVLPERRRTMVVLHVHGIFKVDVAFCGCSNSLCHRHTHISQLMDNAWYPATIANPQTCATYEVLDLFQTLQVVGNINAQDFVQTLELLTDATFTEDVPDRYRAFSVKRAGRAREDNGLRKTEPGGLAVRCWACPEPGRNMPPAWETASQDESFKHALMLAVDANFRMKNRIRAKERSNPSLGPGLGFFVLPDPYKEHIKNYVTEEDVSTCIAFQARAVKDTRMTAGLRVSGVGGCVCARHGLLRPMGIGDLQKGERYANMDWIFLSAVNAAKVKELVVSYDIACQWQVYLHAHAQTIGASPTIVTDLAAYRIQFGLPVWHAEAHEEKCRAANSLLHAEGVGRTDGESIERLWALLNPTSYSTKEMGEGNRQDTIEDKLDYLNFSKNVTQGKTLKRKLLIAIAERDRQKEEFAVLDTTIDGAMRRGWQRQVDVWSRDHSKPNPYLLNELQLGPTEAQVAADLKKAELEELRAGRAERIKSEVKGTSTLTADRASQIDELRVALLKKLKAFRRLQGVYMPAALELLAEEEERRDSDEPPPKAEDIKLWLPSDLSADEQKWACRPVMLDTEAQLREAQCGTSLVKLRSLLFAKSHVISHRNANIVGQRASTQYGTLLSRMTDSIWRQANRYRGSGRGGDSQPLHDAVRVQWCKVLARRSCWEEEVVLIREEMKRVIRDLKTTEREWKDRATRRRNADHQLAHALASYANRQAALHKRIRESFFQEWSFSMTEVVRGLAAEGVNGEEGNGEVSAAAGWEDEDLEPNGDIPRSWGGESPVRYAMSSDI